MNNFHDIDVDFVEHWVIRFYPIGNWDNGSPTGGKLVFYTEEEAWGIFEEFVSEAKTRKLHNVTVDLFHRTPSEWKDVWYIKRLKLWKRR